MDAKAKKKTQMDERLRDMGVNMDQRRKIIAATRLGIGPLASGTSGRSAEADRPMPSLPSVSSASSRAAAAAAASERERRQRELEVAQREDDTDLQAFLAGGKATKKAVKSDREVQRRQVVQRREATGDGDLDAFLAGGRAAAQAAAIVAQRAPAAPVTRAFPMPGQALGSEVRLSEARPSTTPDNAASERPGERPFDPEAPLPPMPRHRPEEAHAPQEEDGEEDDPRLAFLNEQRSAKRRAKKEEMRKRREERLQQLREANAGRVDSDDEDEELANDSDSSDDQKRIRQRDGKISTSKGMDEEKRKFWGESVKGRVSVDYKGFSDAELERRFAVQQASTAGQKLMTEAEVLAMMMNVGSRRDRSRSRKRRR